MHGQLYDLEPFVAHHPGGADWLTMTRGQDITDLFETHHINHAKAVKVLAKYRIKKSAQDSAPAVVDTSAIRTYDWGGNSTFYGTLKKRVFEEFSGKGKAKNGSLMAATGPTTNMLLLSYATLALFAISFLVTTFTGSLLSCVLTGYLLCIAGFGLGHNYFHQNHPHWWLTLSFNLTCFDVIDWKISHAISHHSYANTSIDLEASAVEPWLNYLRNQPSNHPWAVWPIWLLFNSLLGPINYLLTWRFIMLQEQPFRWPNLIPLLEFFLLLTNNSAYHSLALFVAMHGVASLLLMILTTPIHRSQFAWTTGCEGTEAAQADFGLHTVLSTNDYLTSAPLFFKLFAFASFNDHITHHLFPTIDLSQQHRVRQIFLTTAAEFNVKYVRRTFPELAAGTTKVLGRKPGELCYRN